MELAECYGKMITFVKKTEPLVSQDASHQQNRNKVDTGLKFQFTKSHFIIS